MACPLACRSPSRTSSTGSTGAGPGQSKFTTQRREPDAVKILSGVFEGQTTGAPIALMIDNVDARSKDYGAIKDQFRPGHADFTYQAKYGIRDYRGGGRASARETAMRVAAGAIARKVLGEAVTIQGALIQIGPGPHRARRAGTGTRSSATPSGAPTPRPPRAGRRCSWTCASAARRSAR